MMQENVRDTERAAADGLEQQLAELRRQFREETRRRERLEETVRQLRVVLDGSADAIFLVDRESLRFVDVNESACSRLGYSREELLTRGPQDINPGTDRAAMDALMGQFIASGKRAWTFETFHVRKDGTMFPVEINTRLIESEGRPIFVSIARDITYRNWAEQEAIAQFKLAEAFFNHSVSGLVILDKDYNFLRVNEAYARASQRDIGEFAGRNHFDMYPSDAKLTFDEVVRSKRPFATFTRAFSFPDQPERGVTYWDWTLVPVLDQQGEVEYLVFSLSEVTERKRAEEVLRENERLLLEICDALPALVSYVDTQGRFRFVNRKYEEWFGKPRAQITDKTVRELLGEAAYRRVEPYVAEALSGAQVSYEEQLFFEDRGWSDIHAVYVPHLVESGEVYGYLVVVNDVTEAKQAEVRRVAQEKELRETLVREVHHRIKNNLQGVVGLMRQHASRHPEIRAWMEDAIGQINSIAIIHGLQSDTLRDEPRLCEMVGGIAGAVQALTKVSVEPLIEVEVAEPVRVNREEAVPIALILNELIHNAIKHSYGGKTGGPVRVSMSADRQVARVVVRNDCAHSCTGFDFAAGTGLGTGLNLVKSMLPRQGASLEFARTGGAVVATLTLAPPVIRHAAETMA